jgi:hypothetical protein
MTFKNSIPLPAEVFYLCENYDKGGKVIMYKKKEEEEKKKENIQHKDNNTYAEEK